MKLKTRVNERETSRAYRSGDSKKNDNDEENIQLVPSTNINADNHNNIECEPIKVEDSTQEIKADETDNKDESSDKTNTLISEAAPSDETESTKQEKISDTEFNEELENTKPNRGKWAY